MSPAKEYIVTVIDTNIGMANLLRVRHGGASVQEETYERLGRHVVPCGTDLMAFEAASGAKRAVLPVMQADRVVVVLQSTIPAPPTRREDLSYGTDVAAILVNKAHCVDWFNRVADRATRYFEGLSSTRLPRPSGDRAASRTPDDAVAGVHHQAAGTMDVCSGNIRIRFRPSKR